MSTVRTVALLFAACLGTWTAAAQNRPAPVAAAAEPFGVHIGQTTCAQAAQQLRPTTRSRPGGMLMHTVERAARLYDGARSIVFLCRSDNAPVLVLLLEVDKGGMGNPAVAEAYRHLSAKYRLVAGGQPPSLGNGFARFEANQAMIDLEVEHLSFQFTIKFAERAFHAQLLASQRAESEQAVTRRRGAL